MKRNPLKIDWSRRVPMGMDGETVWAFLMGGVSVAWGLSWPFFVRFWNAVDALYTHRGGKQILRAGAEMPAFHEVLGGALTGFGLFALCLPFVVLWNYSYHWQGSRSIYLMRRLPDKWELHRRCLTQPLAALAVCAVAAVATLLVYFAFYWFVPPEECLRGGQWRMLLQTWFF